MKFNIEKKYIFIATMIIISILYCLCFSEESNATNSINNTLEPMAELSGGYSTDYNDKQILLNTLQSMNKGLNQLL